MWSTDSSPSTRSRLTDPGPSPCWTPPAPSAARHRTPPRSRASSSTAPIRCPSPTTATRATTPGQGRSGAHTGATSIFSLREWSVGGLFYDVSGKRERWSALLLPPTGESFEAGRTYQAERGSGPGIADLDVSGFGGCNQSDGTLTVTKLARDTEGTVTAVAPRSCSTARGPNPRCAKPPGRPRCRCRRPCRTCCR